MSSMEEFEMEKRRKALDRDVISLIDKYMQAMEWDVPDVNAAKAKRLILDEIKLAITRIESEL